MLVLFMFLLFPSIGSGFSNDPFQLVQVERDFIFVLDGVKSCRCWEPTELGDNAQNNRTKFTNTSLSLDKARIQEADATIASFRITLPLQSSLPPKQAILFIKNT